MRCFVLESPSLRHSRLRTHATRRALCTLAGTWEQIRTKILRAFGGMMALVATCLGTPPIVASRVPVGQENLKRLVTAIELKPQKSQNRGSSCKLHSKLKTWNLNLKRLVSATEIENFKISTVSCASCAFLAESGRHIQLFNLFDAVFELEMYIDYWTPKVVLPSSAHGCLCHPSWVLWSHYFWWAFEAAGGVLSFMSQPEKQGCHTLERVDLWKFLTSVRWIHLVFSALEEVSLVFTLMVRSTVMVDIVFARLIYCTFYWRWRNPTTICFSSSLSTLIAQRTQWGFEFVEWHGKSIYFPYLLL